MVALTVVMMPGFWRSLRLIVCSLVAASPALAQHTPIAEQLPCESYSESAAVFVGVAGAPVMRRVQLPNHPLLSLKLTPITVERAFLGVKTPVMYLMPLGIEQYATPGRRYLVYGREYRPPDIVMASPGIGAREIEDASADLAFLESLVPGLRGGIVSGAVRFKELTYDWKTRSTTPLNGIVVRIFNDRHSVEAITAADGRFAVQVPAGTYELVPALPEHLAVWDTTSRIHSVVGDGGCTLVTIDTLFNGRVRGVLRGVDGQALSSTTVDLMPADVAPDSTGHIKGTHSVPTNQKGEFEFAGRPAGRYLLGISLYNAPNPFGPSYPRTYYPGTTQKEQAIPVVIERGVAAEGFDFAVPAVLAKGELQVVVETGQRGKLSLCFRQLEDLVSKSSSYKPQPGVALLLPVVEGQRYEVHAHLDFDLGHLESEPFVFTATAEKIPVTLRTDAPRDLHRR